MTKRRKQKVWYWAKENIIMLKIGNDLHDGKIIWRNLADIMKCFFVEIGDL